MVQLLQTLIERIEEEILHAKRIDPDAALCDQMDDNLDESDLKLALIKFQMNRAIEFPKELVPVALTPRELAEAAQSLPKVEKSVFPAFLKKKKLELARLAHEMTAGIRVKF